MRSEDDVTAVYKVSGEDNMAVYESTRRCLQGIFEVLKIDMNKFKINLGPNVEDIATKYKPARRVRFTLGYVEAHEDPEDGALLKEA